MGAILAGLVLALAASSPDAREGPCARARADYDGLAIEDAVRHADQVLAEAQPHPLACLEVKALSLLVLGRLDAARAVLVELFARDPEHPIAEPGLSPAQRGVVDDVRERARPLSAALRAGWRGRDTLRLDVSLVGGLRGAARVRWRVELLPAGERTSGEAPVVGRVASATTAVGADEISRAILDGEVLDAADQVLLPLSLGVGLPPRPPQPVRAAPEASGVPWYVWTALAVAVVGGGAALALLAQPSLPDATGTAGRGDLDR